MKYISPLKITEARLTSTNVPETDYPEWNAATAYAKDQRVIRASLHKVYQRLVAGTTAPAPESDTANWVEVGYTNRWKMFDEKGNTFTTNPTSIVISITPSQVVNSVALLGLTATSVRVKVTDPIEGVVYDNTQNQTSFYGVYDLYTYFYTPIVRDETAIFTDLPSYGKAVLEITITNTTGTAAIGTCLIGQIQSIGGVQYGASVGIQNYSIKQRDSFGNINIVPRSYADRARFNIRLPSGQTDFAKRSLTALRDTPTVYIGSELFDSTVVYGFYKDFDIVLSSFPYSDCSIEIEGLV